jgi:ABC-type proline/glycine betaine transport system permease subunit
MEGRGLHPRPPRGGASIANRIAILGSLIASLALFFLPLVELKPNRLASGIPFYLLQLEGDLRYAILFFLALLPLVIALREKGSTRGWLLAGLGNALFFLTLYLPAVAGEGLIAGARDILGEGVRVSNPRLLPSAALALGLLGAYIVLYGGLRDLAQAGVSKLARAVMAWGGVALAGLFAITGQFDIYSVMVELEARGQQLGQRTVEHVMFVAVALLIGLVLGVGLGLWAHRDRRISPVILYVVGIIQTIPSLALFGVLLVPLARLGDQRAASVGLFFLLALAVAAVLVVLYRRFAERLPGRARQGALILSAVAAAVPLSLLTVVLASFIFRTSFIAFTSRGDTFVVLRALMLAALLGALALWFLSRQLKPGLFRRLSLYGSWGGCASLALFVLVALVLASQQFLGRVESAATLTIRDLGVSGIGTAPAVIALTLYSLLPLVRNTYAGLGNVDPAIIDSGRGMGMTAAQRFLQIELPIALPVIMAGVRNASVALVGIAAIATVVGAGGLGDFILGGIINTSIDQILLGAVPAVLLAVFLDAVLRGLERLTVSPGIRQPQS